MTKILITERQLERLSKKVLTEQSTPGKDKKLNLFCQNDIINDSFHESDLTFVNDEDVRGGISGGGFKTIYLNPSYTIPRETYQMGYNEPIKLNVIPTEKLNPDLLTRTKLVGDGDINFIINKKNSPYFCKIKAGTDAEWSSYLNHL